jgi:hypothetical protein
MERRLKLLLLARFIPFVEKNFNFIELGPRGTGKSYAFSEMSPYCILISGGKATVARMFVNEAADGPDFVATRIEVKISAIEDFASLLAQEMETNFGPSQERIIREHAEGVGFGARHASLDMRVAVNKYFECLSAAVDNLRQFVAASEILIEAANKIAAVYRSADEDVQTMQRKIDRALSEAVDDAARARQAGVEESRRAAMHRRLSHLEQGEPM